MALNLIFALFFSLASMTPVGSYQKTGGSAGYVIHEKTSKVQRVGIRKDTKGTENIVQVAVQNNSGGVGRTNTQVALPPADISSLNVMRGSYNISREMNQTARGKTIQLMDVVYPFRLQLMVSGQVVDFEITEKGFWKVDITVLN